MVQALIRPRLRQVLLIIRQEAIVWRCWIFKWLYARTGVDPHF